jgi:hypothetical protein
VLAALLGSFFLLTAKATHSPATED